MTEEEEQMMMLAMLMRQEEEQAVADLGGHMLALDAPGGGQMEYSRPQQREQGGYSGMSPMQLQNMLGGGGGALGAEGGASIAGLASGEAPVAAGSLYGGYGSAPVAVGAAEGLGAGGAAGGGGGGGMLAAAGPWAALAAIIAGVESEGQKAGRRDEDRDSRVVDMFSGATLEQDADALGDKMGGPLGQATKVVGRLGNPEGMLKTSKKLLMPWEWF